MADIFRSLNLFKYEPTSRTTAVNAQSYLNPLEIQLVGQDRIHGDPGQTHPYDYPNPTLRRDPAGTAVRSQTEVWSNKLPTLLSGHDKIFAGDGQTHPYDWPNPTLPKPPAVTQRTWVDPTKINLIGKDRIYGGPGQVADYDWPNPRGRQPPALFTFPNLLENTLATTQPPFSQEDWPNPRGGYTFIRQPTHRRLYTTEEEAETPFSQEDWPVPRGYASSIALRTWTDSTKINLVGQDSVYGSPGEVPDYDYPNPRGPQYPSSLRTHIQQTPIALIGGSDRIYGDPGQVSSYELPNPRGPVGTISLRSWIDTTKLNLIGQDKFFGLAGHPNFDWPVPRGYTAAIALRTWLDETKIELIGSDRVYGEPGQVPDYEWPVPRAAVPSIALKTWLDPTRVNLVGGLAGSPNFDWPNPRGPQYPSSLRTFLNPTPINLIGQDRIYNDPGQVPDYTWVVPRSLVARTVFDSTNLLNTLTQVQVPVQSYDWPNPRGATPSIALRTWIQTTSQEPPFVPIDWVVPKGPRYPYTLFSYVNQTPINLVGQDRVYGDPGQAPTYNWPNPRGRLYQTLLDPINLLNTTLQVSGIPFNQYDWPLPNRARQPVPFEFRNNTLLQVSPFAQTDWSVPSGAKNNLQKGWIDPTKINLIGQDRIYGDPGEVPSYDYPNPILPRSNILRGWTDSTKINLIGQDRIYNGPGQVPSYDWTNPVLRKGQNTTFFEATNLLSTVLQVKPFLQTEWPVPASAVSYTLRNWINPTKINLIGQDIVYGDRGEVPSYDWPNPNRVRREIISYEFANNLLLQTVFPKPFLQTDWPVPYGRVGSISLKTWIDNTKIQLIGKDVVYGAPGQVPTHVLPNPRGPQRLVVGTFDLSTPYALQNTPPINPEIREHSWPNPRGAEYPYSALSYNPPNLYPLFTLPAPTPVPPEPVVPSIGGLPPRRQRVDVVVSGVVLPINISLVPGIARSISFYPGHVQIDAVATPRRGESINIVFTTIGKPIVGDILQDNMEDFLLILSETLLE